MLLQELQELQLQELQVLVGAIDEYIRIAEQILQVRRGGEAAAAFTAPESALPSPPRRRRPSPTRWQPQGQPTCSFHLPALATPCSMPSRTRSMR